jgi:hypothetical protein
MKNLEVFKIPKKLENGYQEKNLLAAEVSRFLSLALHERKAN